MPDDRSTASSLERDLADLRAEVERLRVENARLLRLLQLTPTQAQPPGPAQTAIFESEPGSVDASSPPGEKVAFYATLFAARTDAYAVRWDNPRSGRGGWMPAVRGGWRRGLRPEQRDYLRLTPQVITEHLSGDGVEIGLYPMLDGDRCHWLAADFDGPSAMLDALAYVKAARAVQTPVALEVSRSGAGAHAWLFFSSAVPAVTVRQIGTGLLREAMALRGQMNLTSYDRLFPSQDVLQTGGLGNLIAAPLSGTARRRGTTVFLDLATLEPYDDQWAYLSTLGRVSAREAERVARRIGQVQVGAGVERLRPATSTKIAVQVPRTIRARLRSTLTVEAAGLPPALLASIKHAATMANPVFYERQRRRASTWDTPRYLQNFDETPAGDVILPRGMLERLGDLIEQAGSSLTLTDEREAGTQQDFTFAATLHPEQQAALDAVLAHDLGVLVALPGSGKTVIACATAAALGVSTLVLVDRKALADQWRTRIQEHLGIKAGQRGGGRTKTTGVIDVATLQTLARHDDLTELVADYGLVIVDECHHVPAAAFEHAVKQIPARRWLGLTATPYRRDQLDDLIALQLGPVRHTITAAPDGTLSARGLNAPRPKPVLHIHATDYRYLGDADPSVPGGISAIYKDLAADVDRNAQIVADIVAARARGRHCLVLTQWVDHLTTFEALLRERDLDPVVLRGGTGAKARAAALSRLDPATSNGPLLVVATGSYVGEGFDCPALDTLFLAAPIAFKGRIVQFVGRILRSYPGKSDAEVHDYHDVLTGVLASSLARRAPGYTSLGFPDPRRVHT